MPSQPPEAESGGREQTTRHVSDDLDFRVGSMWHIFLDNCPFFKQLKKLELEKHLEIVVCPLPLPEKRHAKRRSKKLSPS